MPWGGNCADYAELTDSVLEGLSEGARTPGNSPHPHFGLQIALQSVNAMAALGSELPDQFGIRMAPTHSRRVSSRGEWLLRAAVVEGRRRETPEPWSVAQTMTAAASMADPMTAKV